MQSWNIVFTGKEQAELQRSEVPAPGPGQVLVRATRSLISTGTECICFGRRFEGGTSWEEWVQYPFSPGYNHVGVVEQAGEGVRALKQGDRVGSRYPHHQVVCGRAEHFLPLPPGVPDEDAAWLGMASIAQGGVRRAAHELGDIVVAIGLGLLGQLVVQYARLSGAREVIAVDLAPARLALAAEHGATHTLCLPVQDAREAVADLTQGRLADVVYDITGSAAVFAPALRLVRRFGKLILLGDTGAPSQQHLTGDVINRGLRILGAHDSHAPAAETDHAYWTRQNMIRLFFTYLQRKQMRVDDMVTSRHSPQEAHKVYAMLLRDRSASLGVLFDWTAL